MKKPIKIISISLVALIILAFIIVPKLTSKGEKPEGKQQNQNDQQISAEGYVVKTQTLDNDIKAVGSIMANEQVEVRSEVSKKIRGIYFKEGTYVRKGHLLFKLDSDDLTAKIRKLEVEEKLDMTKFERMKQLKEKGLISQEDYDISENTLEQTRADISITRIDISKTYIYAPFSGIVGLRNVSIGAYANPTIVLTSIQDVSKVKVDFSIPEKYIYLFKKDRLFSLRSMELRVNLTEMFTLTSPKWKTAHVHLYSGQYASTPAESFCRVHLQTFHLCCLKQMMQFLCLLNQLCPKLKDKMFLLLKTGKQNQLMLKLPTGQI